MDTIVVGTPLRFNSVSRPYSFSDGVTIRNLQPILWEFSSARKLMSDDERDELSKSRFWLVVSKEVDVWHLHHDQDLYEKARRSMYALQIICPSGGPNVYMKFLQTPDGFDNIGSMHPAKMQSTLIGRMAILEEQGLEEDFERVYEGVTRAFDEKIVRLENPILLLEHGLQTGNVYLSMLMWVMGLDMLFMAGEKVPFVERAAGFLGPDTPVFTHLPFNNRDSLLTIRDVLEDVYELRNIVAHGREIPAKRFREKFDIVDTNGSRINSTDYYYSQVMMESALFLLVKSLRQVMVERLVDVIKDESNWKQQLKVNARLQKGRTQRKRP